MIRSKYTLFIRVPLTMDREGRFFTGSLWIKDLEQHLRYIEDFHICCPVVLRDSPDDGKEEIRGIPTDHVIPLRPDGGWWSVLRNIVPNFLQVVSALKSTQIVHSDGAGWAFPLSFYLLALRPFIRFRWIVNIESSFWMKQANKRPTLRQWVSHHIHTILLGACLRLADGRIFTHDYYRRYFGLSNERTLISPAVWLDDDVILSEAAQLERLASLPEDEIRFFFPARLIADKGCEVILAAIERTEVLLQGGAFAVEHRILIDISGEGPLAETCRSFANLHQGVIIVRFLEPVTYGQPWFERLRSYHAILLANRTEEQPRVVFDAFSQGVAVITSRTLGVLDIVRENENALVFEIDDADGLARQMMTFVLDKSTRQRLLLATLAAVRGHSHEAMHRTREQFLKDNIGLE